MQLQTTADAKAKDRAERAGWGKRPIPQIELASIKSGYRSASTPLWLTNHLTTTSAPLRILGRQEKLFDLIRLMCKQRMTDSWKPRTVAG